MNEFEKLLEKFLFQRDNVTRRKLGLQHWDKHPEMIKFQKARQELLDYVENK